ncbi:MAG: hypothetical protein ACLSAF_17605 [Intestinimonas sp.]
MGLIHWRAAQRKRSRAESGQTAGAREKCVLCGGETPYLRTVPIDRREGYLEGAGQLCAACCREIFESPQGGTFYSGDKCRYFSAAQRHKSLGFAPWKPCFARCSRASHSIGRGPCPTELPARIRPSSHSLQ